MLDEMLSLLVRAAGNNTSVLVVSAHGVRQRSSDSGEGSRRRQRAMEIAPRYFCRLRLRDSRGMRWYAARQFLMWLRRCSRGLGCPSATTWKGAYWLRALQKRPRSHAWQAGNRRRPVAAPPLSDDSKGAAILRRESDWNLAQSYLDAARHAEALPVLEELFRAFPEQLEAGHALFLCQLTLEMLSEAAETLEVVLEGLPAGVWSLLPRAELCLARGQIREARSLVNEARELHPTHPDALRRLGMLLLRLREWDALADLAKQALKLDDNEALAWLGLAEAQLRKRLAVEAEEAALRAIGLNYYMPEAHFVLARALIAQGKWQQAREAMQVLLQLQPNNRVAATYAKRMDRNPGRRPPGKLIKSMLLTGHLRCVERFVTGFLQSKRRHRSSSNLQSFSSFLQAVNILPKPSLARPCR